MSHRALLVSSVFFLVLGGFVSTASAQTSMQRRAAEQEAEDSGEAAAGQEEEQQAQQPPSDEPVEIRHEEEDSGDRIFVPYTVHKPGLRLDLGFGGGVDVTRFGIGLGYMYALGWEVTTLGEVFAVIRGGIGPDITINVDENGFNGIATFAVARAHAVGTGVGGFGVELGGGGGLGRGGLAPAGRIGVFLSGRYFEAGYFYQIAPYRPDWIAPHNVGFRLHIPIFREYS